MDVIESHLSSTAPDFLENSAYHLALKSELSERLKKIKMGGGADQVKRHYDRKKFLPRERIEKILDEGSAFIEN